VEVSPLSIWSSIWDGYRANREHLIPLATLIAASVVAWAALKQAKIANRNVEIATRQAEIARLRHEEQTKADLQRRITESFTKAVEQLGSEKLQVRLGGIYTLERISRESELDYWPVMETLTGFVREHARWKGEAPALPRIDVHQGSGYGPPTDVAAVLTVIKRRDPRSREREQSQQWWLDLRFADLRRANLTGAYLKEANLSGARLEEATLAGAHLGGANLKRARLERANLSGANVFGANLFGAKLEGANFSLVDGLVQDQLYDTSGDADTVLPKGLTQPAHWPAAQNRS
jgi:Pentapeptide repeats (8 copies)